jgi:hypothetical protein
MIESMLFTHSILVKLFLAFLVVGMLTPLLTVKNPQGLKKAGLIYTFLFQALATMVAFSGIVLFFVAEYSMSTPIIIMIAVWVVMMYIEIRKYKLIKVANLQNPTTNQLIRRAFYMISLVQILLLAAMVVLMVLRAKGVVTL